MGKVSSSDRSNLKREILGVSLLALAVLLALSLFSYNPDDPSFNNKFSEPQKTANLAGVAGSYLADLFFQIFGLTAFLWPFVLILFALKLFRSPELSFPATKVASWIGLFLAVGGSLSLGLGKVNVLGAVFDSGGALGRLLALTGEKYLNFSGAAILLALGLVVSMMVITNLSWMEVSRGFTQLCSSVWEKVADFLKNRRKKKERGGQRGQKTKGICRSGHRGPGGASQRAHPRSGAGKAGAFPFLRFPGILRLCPPSPSSKTRSRKRSK